MLNENLLNDESTCVGKCVGCARTTSGYDRIFDFHVKFATLGSMNLRNDIFETCLRQSARGKTSEWDIRSYYDFVKTYTFHIDLELKSRFSH